MASPKLADALQILQPFAYGGLFLIALIQWRRRPGPASAWLVATFGVLAAVVVAGQVLPEDSSDPAMQWAGKALIATLVLFPYFLYRFTTSLLRPIRWVNVVGTVLTASVAIVPLFLPPFPSQDEATPAWLEIFLIGLLTQWVFLSAVVAVRLWRAGKGQPTVARRRMRTMSVGATGLALALVVGGEFSGSGVAEIAVQLLVLAVAPLMLIGFAPPRMLRAVWRQREEAGLRQAGLSLMEATSTAEVAQVLLPHARTLVGAARATIEDAAGTVLAIDEPDAGTAPSTEDPPGADPAKALNGNVVSVPLRSGRLVVVTSPLTPFFGDDELSALKGLAAQADLALARNELLDNHRRLAAIVESSDDAIFSMTLDGTITSWNGGAERMYGYRADEAIGMSVSTLTPADRDDEPTIRKQIAQGHSIAQYETTRRTKDGRAIDVSLTVSPIKDGEGQVVGASTIARDVSSRKQVEAERETARQEADRANRAKSDFLSRMSHELRTPLNAVLGFAQLLELDPLAPAQQDATREILKAGEHLLELIDEVLDLSRIEAGRLRLSLEPVDAVQVAEECISLLGPQANHEGVSLVMDEPLDGSVYAVADRQRLKQVLLNLISNGIKYNREHGSVRVVVDRTAQGSRIKIDVTDTGRGIPADRLAQLFSPFERLGAEESGIEGTGLGLALTKPLVEAMGGTISVTSEPGQGSTFSVQLASADDDRVLAGDRFTTDLDVAVSALGPASRTVLYVEDNLSNLKLMERVLARRPGIALVSAMQGRMGVTLARAHRPNLILLDLNLPDMSGEEVLRRLRSDPTTGELPVVVISADATDGQRSRLIDAGASDFITKPFDVDGLLQIVDEFCGDPGDAPNGGFPVGSTVSPGLHEDGSR